MLLPQETRLIELWDCFSAGVGQGGAVLALVDLNRLFGSPETERVSEDGESPHDSDVRADQRLNQLHVLLNLSQILLCFCLPAALLDDYQDSNDPNKLQFVPFEVVSQSILDLPEQVTLVHSLEKLLQTLQRLFFDLDIFGVNEGHVAGDDGADLTGSELVARGEEVAEQVEHFFIVEAGLYGG